MKEFGVNTSGMGSIDLNDHPQIDLESMKRFLKRVIAASVKFTLVDPSFCDFDVTKLGGFKQLDASHYRFCTNRRFYLK